MTLIKGPDIMRQGQVVTDYRGLGDSAPTKCQYANKLEIEESEHDVTLVFKREVLGKDMSVARVSVPRSLWESIAE